MRKLAWDEFERPDPEALKHLPKHPIRVLVHNVRSIHNVGSIFRTSDAARIEHVHLTGFTGTPDHKDLHKTALGAQDAVDWSHHEAPLPVINELRDQGYTIAVLEQTSESTPPDDVSTDVYPLCLVVGNEVHGVADDVIEEADLALEIPQYGAKISMNVGVAYGIAIFDLARKYRDVFGPPGEEKRTVD
ncbi:MAG: rRNA methyltransferase [Bacteroidetes bacterium QH_7_62_13]|nr:MAG: rRNA methyltransferase [Bacteroidetes bacterium QH_7_62_13]